MHLVDDDGAVERSVRRAPRSRPMHMCACACVYVHVYATEPTYAHVRMRMCVRACMYAHECVYDLD